MDYDVKIKICFLSYYIVDVFFLEGGGGGGGGGVD